MLTCCQYISFSFYYNKLLLTNITYTLLVNTLDKMYVFLKCKITAHPMMNVYVLTAHEEE